MSLLSILFSRKDVMPSVTVDHAVDDDPVEMIPEEPNDPDFALAGMRIGMAYKDERGLRTKRIVRLKRLDSGEYCSYIHAFCELRKEDRTFRVDRIATLFDPATGEILDDADAFFGPYIERALEEEVRAIEKSQFRGAWDLIEALRDELAVLVLVARADGRFVKAEQSLLLKYAAARAGDLKISLSDEALAVLLNWIKTQDPSEPEVRIAIRNLVDNDGALENIWEVSELIAEADGKVRDDERQAFGEVRKAIETIAAEMS